MPVAGGGVGVSGIPEVGAAGAARGTVSEFAVPTANANPFSIATAIDDSVWFSEVAASQIGRLAPDGTFEEFTVAGNPGGVAFGPDGAVWFTEIGGNRIGRLTATGSVTEFSIPTADSFPHRITLGPDGALWFAEAGADKIGRIATDGTISEFALPSGGSTPFDITAGPDGALWFTEIAGNRIGRISTAGAITEYAVPTAGSQPALIAAGPDGDLWFSEAGGRKIGRIATDGTITEFVLADNGTPQGIAAGPDGALWFTETLPSGAAEIGRITIGGRISSFAVPTAGAVPFGIAAGPDDLMSFTEFAANKIGEIASPPSILTFAAPALSLVQFGTAAGSWTSESQYPRLLADINGDGKADIVGFSSSGVLVSPATGGGQFAAPSFELAQFGAVAGGWVSQNQFPRLLADVNGDGMADIIGFSSTGVVVSLATGGGQFAAPTFQLGEFGAVAGGWASQDQFPRVLADVNGDGMADIVGFSSSGVVVSLATGGGQFAAPAFERAQFGTAVGGWTSNGQYPRMLADVNGDGMADIVGFSSTGVVVSLAEGGGQFAAPSFELAQFGTGAGGWASQDQFPRFLADVNGDGLPDIVGFSGNGVIVSFATGGGHFSATSFELAQFGAAAGGWVSQDQFPRLAGDVTGAGISDIIGFSSNGVVDAPNTIFM